MSSLEIGALVVMGVIAVAFAWYLWSERNAPPPPAGGRDEDDPTDWRWPGGD